jgi:hypothetical protein
MAFPDLNTDAWWLQKSLTFAGDAAPRHDLYWYEPRGPPGPRPVDGVYVWDTRNVVFHNPAHRAVFERKYGPIGLNTYILTTKALFRNLFSKTSIISVNNGMVDRWTAKSYPRADPSEMMLSQPNVLRDDSYYWWFIRRTVVLQVIDNAVEYVPSSQMHTAIAGVESSLMLEFRTWFLAEHAAIVGDVVPSPPAVVLALAEWKSPAGQKAMLIRWHNDRVKSRAYVKKGLMEQVGGEPFADGSVGPTLPVELINHVDSFTGTAANMSSESAVSWDTMSTEERTALIDRSNAAATALAETFAGTDVPANTDEYWCQDMVTVVPKQPNQVFRWDTSAVVFHNEAHRALFVSRWGPLGDGLFVLYEHPEKGYIIFSRTRANLVSPKFISRWVVTEEPETKPSNVLLVRGYPAPEKGYYDRLSYVSADTDVVMGEWQEWYRHERSKIGTVGDPDYDFVLDIFTGVRNQKKLIASWDMEQWELLRNAVLAKDAGGLSQD